MLNMLEPGLILLDKQSEISSAKAIAKVKKQLSCVKKIGHAGTLDPLATGLLVCLINGATKLASYAEAGDKIYSGKIQLGISTNTDDITGEVISESANLPAAKDLLEAARVFVGEIDQQPPNISAVKVDGKRAYKLARAGAELQLSTRRVNVESFELFPLSEKEAAFRVCCSKGTYVRSLARDLGQKLGCGACIKSLRREGSFPFSVDSAKELSDLSDEDLVDWTKLFPKAGELMLSDLREDGLRFGKDKVIKAMLNDLSSVEFKEQREVIAFSKKSNKPLALFIRNGDWRMVVNFAGQS